MKRISVCAVAASLLAASSVSATAFAQPSPERVTFARGASGARLVVDFEGAVRERSFTLRAMAGQRLHVSVEGDREVFVNVESPGDARTGGAWTLASGSVRHSIDARLFDSGDHVLHVMAYRPLRVVVRVSITGAPERANAPFTPQTGHYRRTSNDGDLTLTRDAEDTLRFTLMALWIGPGGRRSGNINLGEARGALDLRGRTAVYATTTCRLVMHFDDGEILLSQQGGDSDCEFGAHVYAGGTYRRTGATR